MEIGEEGKGRREEKRIHPFSPGGVGEAHREGAENRKRGELLSSILFCTTQIE